MSKCFNPDCLYQNPINNKFCERCGQKLLLKDHFRGMSYLGEGGFGRTFVGLDQDRRNSPCVIKQFLPLSQGSNALNKCIQLFEQEAELLEKLGKHPQIPDLLAFFEQEGKLYLIQEFIDGKNLLTELQEKGRYTEDEVKQFLIEMLPVLDFIHQKSVIHRDIKPENILRRNNNLDPLIYGKISNLVLIDFGVSKQISGVVMTKMGTGIGTPAYAPPEQNRGLVNASSDLYSLGVTAVRMLTGVLPEERNGIIVDDIFDLYNLTWIWKNWLEKNQISLDSNLIEILEKMLADKISDRFQTAREVFEALQTNLSLTQIQANIIYDPPITPFPQVTTPTQSTIKLKTALADYHKLDQLLAEKYWQEADQETEKLMLIIMSKTGWWDISSDDLKNLSQKDVQIIDQLWLKYSQEQFGFSIQKEIWLKFGGKLDGSYDINCYSKLAKEVGWKNENEINFNTNIPKGYYPKVSGWGGLVRWMVGVVGGLVNKKGFFSYLYSKV